MCASLNSDERKAFDRIISRVASKQPGLFFVSGYGGTRKTFLWNALSSYLRLARMIVLTVASFVVASLLLPRGMTTHSRFKISLDDDEMSVCDIRRGSMLAELIRATSLIVWDEALMAHRKCFKTFDRTLHDLLSTDDVSACNVPFGGRILVLGGDLRQILLVIERGGVGLR